MVKIHRYGRGDVFVIAVIYILAIVIAVLVAIPVLHIIAASFSEPERVRANDVFITPKDFTFNSYIFAMNYDAIWTGFFNSAIYVVVGCIISIILTVILSYTMSIKELFGKKFLTILVMIPLFFSGGIIPTYLLMSSLRLIDTRIVVVLPAALSMFNVLVARTFFSQLPKELYEVAKIEGCGEIYYLIKIVLPLSKAIIAVLLLWYGIGYWNSYTNALIYLQDTDKYPLQMILRQILVLNQLLLKDMSRNPELLLAHLQMQDVLKYVLIIISSVPMIIVYPFAQKYFVSGVMLGSIKG